MKIIFLTLASLVFSVSAWMKCISIYGLETPAKNFVCTWTNPLEFYVKELARLKFDTLRLPFSYEWVRQGDFSKMDLFFDVAEKYNVSVLLDLHRVWSDHQGPGPEEGISLNEFLWNGWMPVLNRYVNRTVLKGHNVYNEYTGNDVGYITHYSEVVIRAIEEKFPGRFDHYVTGYVWASTLHTLDLDYLPRVRYSIHRYKWHGYNENDWDHHFSHHNSSEILVGEFGFKTQDFDWARQFINYLKRRNIRDACFWTIAYSSDTDGLWHDDCTNLDWQKYEVLDQLWR
jgi:hypothetical protein